MCFCYKVSKYNPLFYVDDVFVKNEWTDFSDIGKSFDGEQLTLTEYEKIENNYINFVVEIANVINLSKFRILDLQIYDSVLWENEQEISLSNLPMLIKDCLRNKCWCKIHEERFCLCFGFDFYLHLKCEVDYALVNKISEKNSLYVQKYNNQLCDKNLNE